MIHFVRTPRRQTKFRGRLFKFISKSHTERKVQGKWHKAAGKKAQEITKQQPQMPASWLHRSIRSARGHPLALSIRAALFYIAAHTVRRSFSFTYMQRECIEQPTSLRNTTPAPRPRDTAPPPGSWRRARGAEAIHLHQKRILCKNLAQRAERACPK